MASSMDPLKNDTQELDFESMDPTKWKDQDHYKVLGLGLLRHKATKGDIKKSYRQLILKYHPDKQAAGNEIPNVDNVFACIKQAYDQLWDTKKRQSYDSVDPFFDDEVPSLTPGASREEFYRTFGPVFESNSRWSTTQPVPQLGDESSTYAEVDAFYSFWYEFESWREFSYQDKEDSKKGEDRDERRWLEKQNKVERVQKKKEEGARMRSLVDKAYACDSRVKRFKEEQRQLKESQKKAKEEAARKQEEQKEKEKRDALERKRLAKEEEDATAKAEADVLKKEREAKKKELKIRRKALRGLCKEAGYFLPPGREGAGSTMERVEDLELLCDVMKSQALEELVQQLKGLSLEEGQQVFCSCVSRVKERLDGQARDQLKQQDSRGQDEEVVEAPGGGATAEWSSTEMEVLVKAVKMFPPGTLKRWDTIADYINFHVPSSNKTSKQVIKVVKNLQQSDNFLKVAEHQQHIFSRFEHDHLNKLQTTAGITERFDGSGVTITRVERPWSQDEQKLLEAGLKSVPSSDHVRWDRISAAIPTRTRRECLVRFKELIDQVRRKQTSS